MSVPHDGLLLSVPFWLAFAAWLVVERGIDGVVPRRLHYFATTIASAAFLWAFTGIGATYLAALYGALTVVFWAGRRALTGTGGSRLPLAVGLVALLWALGKVGDSLDLERLSWLFFLGASFLLVKIWTFLKDLADGRIDDPEWASFLAYCTFFPCFLSGPMHYYGEFRQAFEKRLPLAAADLVDGVHRLLLGMVKVLIVAVALRPFSLETLDGAGLSTVSTADLLVKSAVYSLVIYLDFSGYSDIAISAGRLLGVRVPENFRLPYFAPNLRDFWQRWHITFTRFLTQYLFIPFVRVFQARVAGAGATLTASTAYLATFAFCGFWHGSTANFLAWGVYHGLGLAGYDYWRQRRMAAARRAGKLLTPPGRLAHGALAALTFLFVSVGWIFFVLPLGFWTR